MNERRTVLRLKSYFRDSLEEAGEAAAAELGSRAELLYSRRTPFGSRELGRLEAVFATRDERAPEAAAAAEPPRAPAHNIGLVRERLVEVIRDLEPPAAGPARQQLPRTDASVRGMAIIAGPPGAGKTSAAVRIAARLAALGGPPPVLAELVWHGRPPGPLEAHAAAIGCPFEALPGPDAAGPLRARAASGAPVIVDTPGAGWADAETIAGLARLRQECPGADVHLALSAELSAADLCAAVERFERIRPTRLLFTRLDETSTYGSLWPEAVRRNLPVSYLTFGQRIPGDIEPATAVRLAGLAARPGRDWLAARDRKARAAGA